MNSRKEELEQKNQSLSLPSVDDTGTTASVPGVVIIPPTLSFESITNDDRILGAWTVNANHIEIVSVVFGETPEEDYSPQLELPTMPGQSIIVFLVSDDYLGKLPPDKGVTIIKE